MKRTYIVTTTYTRKQGEVIHPVLGCVLAEDRKQAMKAARLAWGANFTSVRLCSPEMASRFRVIEW